MEVRTQAHAAYKLEYHVVWTTKFRLKIFKAGVGKYAEKVLVGVTKVRYPDIQIEEINVQEDHIHMMVSIPPKYAISTVIGRMKSDSAKRLKDRFSHIERGRSVWSIGYFVSSVGIDEEKIRRYVKYQEKQDKGQTKFAI